MRNNKIHLVHLLVLLCAISLLYGNIPIATAASTSHKEVKVMMLGAPMGSTMYAMGQGLEELTRAKHPWLRIVNAEGPGCAGCTYNMLTNPAWKNRIACSSQLDVGLAHLGLSIYKKPFPDFREKVKVLFNYCNNLFGLITMDPKIRTEQDLAGKRVGLGTIGNAGYTITHLLVLQKYADPPVPNVKIDFLGPKKAPEMMVDGAVDVCSIIEVANYDFSNIYHQSPMNDLISRKIDVYWLTTTDRTIAKAKGVLGYKELPPNTLGGHQPRPIKIYLDRSHVSCSAELPEEIAYEFVKFVIKYGGELQRYHKVLSPLGTPEFLCMGRSEEEFHPGALRAYKEAGLIK